MALPPVLSSPPAVAPQGQADIPAQPLCHCAAGGLLFEAGLCSVPAGKKGGWGCAGVETGGWGCAGVETGGWGCAGGIVRFSLPCPSQAAVQAIFHPASQGWACLSSHGLQRLEPHCAFASSTSIPRLLSPPSFTSSSPSFPPPFTSPSI